MSAAEKPAQSFVLAPVEVEELTGAARAKGQMEWLRAEGIPAAMGRDGKVKVLRAAVEARMMPTKGRPAAAKTGPDLTQLKKAS